MQQCHSRQQRPSKPKSTSLPPPRPPYSPPTSSPPPDLLSLLSHPPPNQPQTAPIPSTKTHLMAPSYPSAILISHGDFQLPTLCATSSPFLHIPPFPYPLLSPPVSPLTTLAPNPFSARLHPSPKQPSPLPSPPFPRHPSQVVKPTNPLHEIPNQLFIFSPRIQD